MWPKLFQSNSLNIFILSGFWLWRSQNIFTPKGLFPLNPLSYEKLFALFGGYRLILSSNFEPFLSGLIAVSPLGILIACYFLIRRILPDNIQHRETLALLGTAGISFLADPGKADNNLNFIFYSLLLLTPLFQSQFRPLSFWMSLNISGFLALLIPSLQILLVWLLISLCIRECIEIFFIKRTKPNRQERQKPRPHVLFAIAISLCLCSWILYINPDLSSLQNHQQWWTPILSCSLLVGLSFFRPWDTSKWAGLGSFQLGALIIPELIPAVILSLFLIALDYLRLLLNSKILGIRVPKPLISASHLTLSLLILHYSTSQYSTEREFSPAWPSLAIELKEKESGNISLIGNAMAYLSFFHPGQILENPHTLLEHSEQKLMEWMEKENIQAWLIDKSFLTHYWRKLIQNGTDPDTINRSVLSRISLYDGQAVETKTLQLQPVHYLKQVSLAFDSFVLIQRQKQP